MKNLPSVLILSLSATGVAVARAFASHNVRVYGTDHQFAAGIFSKFINRPFFGYKVRLDENLLENMIAFSKKQSLKPVLFPSDDRFIEFVSNNYDELNNHFIMQKSLAPDVSKTFLNKNKFYELCDKHNVMYPKSFFLNGDETVEDVMEHVSFPMILKPYLIHKWKKRLHGNKVILIKNAHELKDVLSKWRNDLQHMMIQEVIGGKESDIWIFKGYFDENGRVLCSFTGRKLRQYPPVFGSASLAESVSNSELNKTSVDFLTSLRFHGLCGAEFKFDRSDGAYKMIEVNIRPQLWDDLMRIAGKEIIWTAYCDMIGDKASESEQKYDIKWIYLTRDILSAFWHIRKNNLSFPEYIKSYKGLRTEAFFDIRDIKTFFGVPVDSLCQFYKYYISSKE